MYIARLIVRGVRESAEKPSLYRSDDHRLTEFNVSIGRTPHKYSKQIDILQYQIPIQNKWEKRSRKLMDPVVQTDIGLSLSRMKYEGLIYLGKK